jgi:hypothetical protein
VVGFAAASTARGSSLRAAQILGAGKFVTAVIDDVVTRKPGCDKGAQLGDLHLHCDHGKD